MREIKFRGQRTLTKQWVYGNLMIKREESPIPETTELYTQHYIVPISGLDYYEYEVDPSTIGQYTGLKDINGKEIYEGDMLICENFIVIVRWNEELATFAVQFSFEGKIGNMSLGEWKNMEIIGSIHDNPQLLEGGEE